MDSSVACALGFNNLPSLKYRASFKDCSEDLFPTELKNYHNHEALWFSSLGLNDWFFKKIRRCKNLRHYKYFMKIL